MRLTPETTQVLLALVVNMAEIDTPGREEASLGTIARRLGELGEWTLMRSLNAHRERFQTVIQFMG